MQCKIIAVGQKMPSWCQSACEEYHKRLQRFLKCSLVEIPTATRHKNSPLCKQEEGEKIQQKILPSDYVVALDVKGKMRTTLSLSEALADWQLQGKNLVFLIGGPEGLSCACLSRANEQWSLSDLTFPHALVRVLLLEQLYRASSLLAHHPYHRE